MSCASHMLRTLEAVSNKYSRTFMNGNRKKPIPWQGWSSTKCIFTLSALILLLDPSVRKYDKRDNFWRLPERVIFKRKSIRQTWRAQQTLIRMKTTLQLFLEMASDNNSIQTVGVPLKTPSWNINHNSPNFLQKYWLWIHHLWVYYENLHWTYLKCWNVTCTLLFSLILHFTMQSRKCRFLTSKRPLTHYMYIYTVYMFVYTYLSWIHFMGFHQLFQEVKSCEPFLMIYICFPFRKLTGPFLMDPITGLASSSWVLEYIFSSWPE